MLCYEHQVKSECMWIEFNTCKNSSYIIRLLTSRYISNAMLRQQNYMAQIEQQHSSRYKIRKMRILIPIFKLKMFKAYKQESTAWEYPSSMNNIYILSQQRLTFKYHKLVTNSKLLVYAELNGIKWKISK
jgi:hypothetical protein